jgi:hypothetical protein
VLVSFSLDSRTGLTGRELVLDRVLHHHLLMHTLGQVGHAGLSSMSWMISCRRAYREVGGGRGPPLAARARTDRSSGRSGFLCKHGDPFSRVHRRFMASAGVGHHLAEHVLGPKHRDSSLRRVDRGIRCAKACFAGARRRVSAADPARGLCSTNELARSIGLVDFVVFCLAALAMGGSIWSGLEPGERSELLLGLLC